MNKIKAILLDADGLLLKQQRYFSEIYSEQYKVPSELIIPFFKTKFGDCQRGVADMKEELVTFLKQWGWNKTVEEFLDYWFSSCTEIDSDVLEMVESLRGKGFKCYLATDQDKYRGEYIKKNLGLENHLDGFFYSYELGYSKMEEGFFENVLRKLNLEPSEVMFCDDDEKNVEVAKKLGISSFTVSGAENFRKIVDNL